MSTNMNRRAILAGAATAAVALPAIAAPAPEVDPIFAVIEKHKQLSAAANESICKFGDAQDAVPSDDPRPFTLVAWRKYSAIGGGEIEAAREEFLAEPGANRERVEREYAKVKAAYRANLRAEVDWYDRHGITPLRIEDRRLWRQVNEAEDDLETTRPTTIAGAGALVAHAHAEMVEYEDMTPPSWIVGALANAATVLKKITAAT
jgi:hypothetical protein